MQEPEYQGICFKTDFYLKTKVKDMKQKVGIREERVELRGVGGSSRG